MISINNEFSPIRQSPIILISKILIAELLINSIYFFPRLLKVYFDDVINQELYFYLNGASIVLYLLVILVQLAAITYIVIEWSNNLFIVKDNEIVHRRGVFSFKEDSYSLRNVEAFMLDQTFIGRILNFGTIHFYSPVLKQEYYIENVGSPSKLKENIENMVSSHKSGNKGQLIIPKR